MTNKLDNKEFLHRMNLINNKISFLEEYKNSHEKIKCKCLICGNEWKVAPTKLFIGRGCPECAKILRGKKIQKTNDEFLERLKKVTNTIKPLEKYRGADEKLKCKCKLCGHIWYPTPSNLYAGKGCPKCSKVYHRTHKEFVEEMKKINSKIIILGQFINTSTKVECQCKRCGYKWHSEPSSLLAGNGCANCAHVLKRNPIDFKREMNTKYKDTNISILGEYVNANTPILCQCGKCGITWNATVSNIIKEIHCPQCGPKARIKTTEFFKKEVKKINPNIKILGEYKRAHAKVNCKCLACGFTFPATAHSILQGHGCPKCMGFYKTNTEFINEFNKLRKNDNIIFLSEYVNSKEKIKCKCLICNNTWDAIPSSLLRGTGCPNCNHMSTSYCEQFIYNAINLRVAAKNRSNSEIGKELDIVIPTKKIAIEYGSWFWHKNRIIEDIIKHDLCKKINYDLLIIYDGMPINEMNKLDKKINYVCYKEFLGSKKDDRLLKLLVKKIYDYLNISKYPTNEEWKKISELSYISSRRKSEERYIKQLKVNNPNIELVGDYLGDSVKTFFKCNMCGYIWETKAYSVLNGSGCPKCAGNVKLSNQEFLSRMYVLNNKISFLEEYKNSHEKIKCKCLICGNEWKASPTKLFLGRGCPECAKKISGRKRKKTNDDFLKRLEVVTNKIEPLEKYNGSDTKLKCRCKICNHVWYPTPSNLYAGKGCPNCAVKKRKRIK